MCRILISLYDYHLCMLTQNNYDFKIRILSTRSLVRAKEFTNSSGKITKLSFSRMFI